MSTNRQELEIIRQLLFNLNDDKKLFLKSIKPNKVSSKNLAPLKTKEAKECPHCKSTNFIKNGKTKDKQRYICKECDKTFVNTNNTIFYGVKKDTSVWQKYIHCMIEKYSLRKTAEICNISLPTAFVWRHKILDALT